MKNTQRMLLLLPLLVVAGVFGVRASMDSKAVEVETVALTTGATRMVADGRVQLWLGAVGASSRDSVTVDAVEIELNCDDHQHKTRAVSSHPSKVMCGCQVRLVEVLDTRPPSARLEITWSNRFNPNLQAAAYVETTHDPRAGTGSTKKAHRRSK